MKTVFQERLERSISLLLGFAQGIIDDYGIFYAKEDLLYYALTEKSINEFIINHMRQSVKLISGKE